jgi:dihydroorotase-like cyclic amidohydrolase
MCRLLSCMALALIMFADSAPLCPSDQPVYDVVILNGRVMDPESKLDVVCNIGISGDSIKIITPEPVKGRATIDAKGLVVAPGFIDLHQHDNEPSDYARKAADGVTTALDLETGTTDVDAWYATREGKALINYGVSAGHLPSRKNRIPLET